MRKARGSGKREQREQRKPRKGREKAVGATGRDSAGRFAGRNAWRFKKGKPGGPGRPRKPYRKALEEMEPDALQQLANDVRLRRRQGFLARQFVLEQLHGKATQPIRGEGKGVPVRLVDTIVVREIAEARDGGTVVEQP